MDDPLEPKIRITGDVIRQMAKGFKSAITLIEQLAHTVEVNSSNDFRPTYNDSGATGLAGLTGYGAAELHNS